MASPSDLKHRPTQQIQSQQQAQPPPSAAAHDDKMNRRKPKSSARRGLKSLSVAVGFPLSLTLLDIFLFGSTTHYLEPFSFPPLWAVHLACLAAAFLSGLSAWLVWAEGGFHRNPCALALYLGQLALSLIWYPVVFGAGAIRVGLLVCGSLFGVLLGCSRAFSDMNPIAGDLVKPCLAWALLLAVANVKLVYQ